VLDLAQVDDLLYYAVSAAGAAVFWWRYRRRRAGSHPRLRPHELRDEEMEIVMHVAGHEAKARGQSILVEHLLLALVQSESVGGAIRSAGGDAEAVEDRVSAALDAAPRAHGPLLVSDAAATALSMTAGMAAHHGRPATCADLWFALLRPPRGGELVAAAGVDPTAVLFVLAHGVAERELAAPTTEPRELSTSRGRDEIDDVELVLVNDDFSPQELVVHVLRDELGLREDEATRLMLKTHNEGRASLGRYPTARARKAAAAMIAVARSRGYPLWIQLLP
jgi:ATP-dependent Clp protease adapter protein ClpS